MLRVGFDLDGVLADFSTAFHEIEERLFGPGPGIRAGEPETEEAVETTGTAAEAGEREEPAAEGAERPWVLPTASETKELRRRRDLIWKEIRAIPDFWVTLKPIEPAAVARIHRLMIEHRWEVFFITQRPATEGDTVQRQTQRWLVSQGFDLPSVLVIGGSRGAAAAALRLDYHVDDHPQHCLDVIADSRARAILISPAADVAAASARKLGVGVTSSIGECLDVLEQATRARTNPTLFQRLASMVGWK